MKTALACLVCLACLAEGFVALAPAHTPLEAVRVPQLRMAQSNEDRKAAIAAAQAKKAATVAKRQKAIDALRAWAALSRKKQALAKQEEQQARTAKVAAPKPRGDAARKAAVQPSPASTRSQQEPGLLDTYRELAVTKAKLALARKANEMKEAVESAKRQLPGGE